MERVWTVSEATRAVREAIEADDRLQGVVIEGELSNFTRARSGHLYFTLKDSSSQLRCVMWKWQAQRLWLEPQDGQAVRAHGKITVYEAGGAYQLQVDWLAAAGVGDLHQQFEALKAKLEGEGLFDPERKRPLPAFPTRLGVVTSPGAAALQDVLNVLGRRWPLAEVILAPTLVQGVAAPSQIIRALVALDSQDVDLVIVTRGGGSLEDLWAFNDEGVARAIAYSRHPVVSGVGHETDFTIADYVADVRAPTPSAAAELATPDRDELLDLLDGVQRRLRAEMDELLQARRWRQQTAGLRLRALSPRQRILGWHQRLDELSGRLERAMVSWLRHRHGQLDALGRALNAVSPGATLQRGYAIVRQVVTGDVITDPAQVTAGDPLTIQVRAGAFTARVTDEEGIDG